VNAALGAGFAALGLSASVVAVVTLAVGLRRGRPGLLGQAPIYGALVVLAAVGGVVMMERALITRDFSVRFVAENGSTRTPALFNVASLWSALEGSLLLWVLVLAGYLGAVLWMVRRRLSDPMVAWALLTMFVVTAFFFMLLVGPANPFERVSPVPSDGPGPNPLLQNHLLMAFHPPMLYLGYVGFTVPFAFAIAALATGRIGEGWLVEMRRWTLFAWAFLTAGIILGSWWSYEVLGWGGYWAWDPVENASLLPWLTGTAYLHSVMVQERRGMLRVWNLSLVCATFALTILGTFITRSGILASVHAFSESGIGPLLLGFFAVIVAVTIGLITWRADRLRSPGRIDSPLSREGAFLANNLLFGVFAFVVLLGTVFPLLVEAVDGRRISVGNPYFDSTTMPIGFTLLFLMAVAPALPWRKASTELLAHRLIWPCWAGAGAMLLALGLGARGWAPMVAFGLAGFAGGAAVRQLVLATRRQGWRGLVGRTNGGMVVHIGVIIIAVALAASSSYLRQAEMRLEPGATGVLAGHEITYLSTEHVESPEKVSEVVRIEIDGRPYGPRLSTFPFAGMTIGEPVTDWGPTRDVQVSVLSAEGEPGQPVVLRVTVQPLVSWLWIGGGVIVLGTVLAAFPGRRRRPTMPVSALLPLDDEPSSDERDGGEGPSGASPEGSSAGTPAVGAR
jgi:cytochrome c-type biogenesis protein CcmF